ncbi:MAG: histidine ammonia-lyase [Cyclobacteriaceae bacterium]|nr:histidine ammonia-lyase [Cyclobacteriaceae bacterium]
MTSDKNSFNYGQGRMTASTALDICRGKTTGIIDGGTRRRIEKSHQEVRKIVGSEKIVYGINTGFGSLCQTVISREDTRKLQENLLRSHSVGVGDPVPDEIVRLMIILKVHSLCYGYSGINFQTIERILWFLNHDYLPMVPSKGSLGASGDLAPLAHLFLPLIGLGKVKNHGVFTDTGQIYQKEGLAPLVLEPKEGLALINGTQFIAAFTVRILEKLHNCLDAADIIGAMTLEGLLGSSKPFDDDIHRLRPFEGVLHVAHRMKVLLDKSEMVASHASCGRVQDPYSIRCIPQVHGATRNAWRHLNQLATIEFNSVTDNPVIFNAENTVSGGNFHGQPLALPLDYCGLAASELGNISERRTYLLLQGGIEGLPALLMRNTGINSGFMIPQYTAAALVSENKSLCYPASADSIPSSLGQEDHVSMGSISARKTFTIIDNLELILAVELLCAAQAFDYRRPMKSGAIIEACHDMIRDKIDHAEEDRIFANDIQAAHEIITSGMLINKTYEIAGITGINLKGKYHEAFGIY